MGKIGGLIGLLSGLQKFAAWFQAWGKTNAADDQLHGLAVGENTSVQFPGDLEARCRSRGAKGKKRFRTKTIDFDTNVIVVERMPDAK